jgi:hypothetical protein
MIRPAPGTDLQRIDLACMQHEVARGFSKGSLEHEGRSSAILAVRGAMVSRQPSIERLLARRLAHLPMHGIEVHVKQDGHLIDLRTQVFPTSGGRVLASGRPIECLIELAANIGLAQLANYYLLATNDLVAGIDDAAITAGSAIDDIRLGAVC